MSRAASPPAQVRPPVQAPLVRRLVAMVLAAWRAAGHGWQRLSLRARWWLGGGVGVGIGVAIVLAVLLAGGPGAEPRDPEIATIRTSLLRDPAGARTAAEGLALRRPRDARVFALLGDVLVAPPRPDPARAMAAYREAVRLDRSAAVRGSELLVTLAGLLDDPRHGTAALDLAIDLGPAAGEVLGAYAASGHDLARRRRAVAALERLGAGGRLDRVAVYAADLAQGKTCAERRDAVRRLAATGDVRAVEPLRTALARQGERRAEEPNACIYEDIRRALAALGK